VQAGGRAACRPRRAQQRAEELPLRPGEAADGPGIAPVEGFDQRRRTRGLETEPRDHRRHQGRKIEIDGKLADAQRRNRLGGEQDHLDIGLSRCRADELDAGLAELALGPEVGALHPQHLAGIGETQGPGLAPQPRGGDARDLERHIGAQCHHALGDRVHQPEAELRHSGTGTAQQALLELHQRRLYPLIAMAGEDAHELLHHRRLMGGFGRQHILQSGRQQR
jgi:hypothetical protein